MTNLTIRIEESLKKQAHKQAKMMGIPLTLVVKNALVTFVKSQKFTIGEVQPIEVTPKIQAKMDEIGRLLNKK